MVKIFKCPFCDKPPEVMQNNAGSCGADKCSERHQQLKDEEAAEKERLKALRLRVMFFGNDSKTI